MNAQPPELVISIVNWNTRDYLLECLESLRSHPPRSSHLTVVVDNASTDGSAEAVAAQFPDVHLIRNTANAGYAAGNNQALSVADAHFYLLLNPDVVVGAGALDGAMDFLRSRRRAAAVGVRLLSPDGSTQLSIRGFPYPLFIACEWLSLWRLPVLRRWCDPYRMRSFDYGREQAVDQPMGSFLMLSGDAVREVGMLDTRFPIFFNEVDWCYRAAAEHKWSIWYSPAISVKHYGGGSTKQVKPEMRRESYRSLLVFYQKHFPRGLGWLVIQLLRMIVRTPNSSADAASKVQVS